MKYVLMRPAAALFPIVLLAASLLGAEYECAELFVTWIALQVCTLCSAGAFRNAAAREPGMRRVDWLFSSALLLTLIGTAIVAAVNYFFAWREEGFLGCVGLFIAAVGIIFEQVFEERMYALSRPVDGVMLSVISSALLFVGLMLDLSETYVMDVPNFFTGCSGVLMLLISVVSAYIVQPICGFSLVPRSIPDFPKACIQSLMYFVMAALLGIVMLNGQGSEMILKMEHDYSPIFFGLIPWQLARTVCRRAGDESRPLNLLLISFAAIPLMASVAVSCFLPEYAGAAQWMQSCGFMAVAALLAGLAVYCAPGVRIYIGAILTVISMILSMTANLNWISIAACVLSLISILLNLDRAFLRRV